MLKPVLSLLATSVVIEQASTLLADNPPASSQWPIYRQDDRTCVSNTSHFTGQVPVSAGNSLFFWFFESRTQPLTRPTVIWLSGGPAASSMNGLFEEIGPCMFAANDTGTTVINPYSWANFANLLFLDQPAGVGFSTAPNGSYPETLAQASPDFSLFMSQFVNRFPQYFQHGFYVAGESFAGRYIPRYAADIVQKQRQKAPGAVAANLTGIILVDALVDEMYTYLGEYEMFCSDHPVVLRFNDSACDAIAAASVQLEQLGRACQLTYDVETCDMSSDYGRGVVNRFLRELVTTKRQSPYDLRMSCEKDPRCIPDKQFSAEGYLSRPEIQTLLGIPNHIEFKAINFGLNSRWSRQTEIVLPTTREVVYLLDEASARTLVLNGNFDAQPTTPGMFREWDDTPWRGNAPFRIQPRRDWSWKDSKGASHKGGQTKSWGRLSIASVDGAGHSCSGDQREAVSHLVAEWMST